MRTGKVHWPLLLGVTAVSVLMLFLVALLKAEFFIVVLPLIAIAFVAYVLYTFLLALGYGDKVEEKKEKSDDDESKA